MSEVMYDLGYTFILEGRETIGEIRRIREIQFLMRGKEGSVRKNIYVYKYICIYGRKDRVNIYGV